jgi:hypothetical protein
MIQKMKQSTVSTVVLGGPTADVVLPLQVFNGPISDDRSCLWEQWRSQRLGAQPRVRIATWPGALPRGETTLLPNGNE